MRATAQSDKPTLQLMLGASGSGRSFLGKRIHEMSPRKDKPLVEISCLEPLLSESLIASAERARGGTLLVTDLDRLDEHGQRELRCLLAKCSEWDRPPRLVTTALPELEVLAKRRLFMRSLYDQVAVLRHRIPSLRERFDDLPELCRLLLAEHSHTEDRAAQRYCPKDLPRCATTLGRATSASYPTSCCKCCCGPPVPSTARQSRRCCPPTQPPMRFIYRSAPHWLKQSKR
jgi:DNA-binding NtrC family response regulator